MRFTVRLPSGLVRPFAHAGTFEAYLLGWSDASYLKTWSTPFACSIQSRVAPF